VSGQLLWLKVDGIPGTLSVALLAVQRELLCFVIRIGGIVVIIRVTPGTRVGCIVVVAIVTGRAVAFEQ
jgi:hypothetical protein